MTVVGVRPPSALAASRRLFDALEQAFPVRFEPWREDARYAAVIAGDEASVPADVPAVILRSAASEPAGEIVRICDGNRVDRRLQGATLPCVVTGAPLTPGDGEVVVAAGADGAAWTRTGAHDRVRATLPTLGEDEVLRDALFAVDRRLALIAVIELLRGLTAAEGYAPPPLRATMVFDDPNLRWRSYGFISYGDLVKHADQHGYHASMAMIPLDAWGPHRPAVKLFRERSDRLSLLMHGNDHRKEELFGQHDPDAALRLGAQALRRVARFESRTGLRVGRVMVPPHGMVSQTMARALANLPFAALCSIHPFPWTGTPPADQLLAGWGPATFPEGCAVIPRVLFTQPEVDLVLRAYMDHPIVLYGHHEDLADGLDVLATAAQRVNRLGEVQWMSPEALVLSNVEQRRAGDTLHIRPYARRVRLEPGAPALAVEAPCAGLIGWSFGSRAEVHPFGVPVPADAEPFEIRLRSSSEVDPAPLPAPPRSVWPHARRIATETRDRLMPLRPVRRAP